MLLCVISKHTKQDMFVSNTLTAVGVRPTPYNEWTAKSSPCTPSTSQDSLHRFQKCLSVMFVPLNIHDFQKFRKQITVLQGIWPLSIWITNHSEGNRKMNSMHQSWSFWGMQCRIGTSLAGIARGKAFRIRILAQVFVVRKIGLRYTTKRKIK